MLDLGKELKRIRESLGKSQTEMADYLGVPQTTWSRYETGKTEPPMKVLFSLAEKGYPIDGLTTSPIDDVAKETGLDKAEIVRRLKLLQRLNLNPDMPVAEAGRIVRMVQQAEAGLAPLKNRGELPSNAFLVPMLDQSLSAGSGTAVPDSDTVVGYVAVPNELRRYGDKVAALTVRGDSMEPTLYDGDMVLCDSGGWDGEGVYAVKIDGEGFVKRLSKRPLGLAVISDNAKYPAYEVPGEQVDVVGRVRYGIRKM